ncbi:EAL domain-containing protein [Paracidobacterium acidisoli]|uniref:EAL domain-containing protein n=1 Tax=Paracidobacterium acidisoli TaxID=2303751 RepID=A0A372INU0_9BACT|nr:EAL domain-containing protein [Paracidobacterium acidisoli]MBT9330916.1 EAL domain-containing protein [Paracidobacterium acidisoli]
MSPLNENDLRKALERDEIVPWFQSIVELRTGRLSGFEVLARWQHPENGLIPPVDFIPLAERTELIGSLTERLLTQAFAVGAGLPEHLTLSVNISPIQLRNRIFASRLHAVAERAHFPFRRLIVEITESALVLNLELASVIAEELKEMGAQLALDDFGTGYSSLRHLQALPLDRIKIDSSFVRSMNYQRGSRKIAAAVVGLGHSLGMETVAEGIEEQEQAEMLFRMGCELGQGWLFSRAVPAAELPAILAAKTLGTVANVSAPKPPGEEVALQLEALPAQRLAQLQAIYDGAPVGLCFLDRNLRYRSLNRCLAEITGKPLSQHLGRTVAEILPEAFAEVEPWLHRALMGESISDLEIERPHAQEPGGKKYLLMSYEPVRDEAGEIMGVSCAVVDITLRKKAQEALIESEDHYRNAVELNAEVPWTADAEGAILDSGPKWESLTGQTKEQTRGDGWKQAVHPDDLERVQNIWNVCLRTGRPLDIEYRVGRGDGKWRWVRARAAARRGSGGKIVRWYGTVEDIDDRKRAEEALRQSEARLQAVFQAVPVGIVIAEAPGGRIVMGNPQAEAILGRPLFRGVDLAEQQQGVVFYPDGEPVHARDLPLERAIFFGKTTDAEEFRYRRGDGQMIWICVTAAPIQSADGTITGCVAAITNANDGAGERERLRHIVEDLQARLAASTS